MGYAKGWNVLWTCGAASAAVACSESEQPKDVESRTAAEPDADSESMELPRAALAFHRFLPVGEQTTVNAPGLLLDIEVIAGDEPLELETQDEVWTATCRSGGVACARASYDPVDPEGTSVQTKCFVCVEELGDCSTGNPVPLPLERHAKDESIGDSNYLASGQGELYRVCEMSGHYVLERSSMPLPPLQIRVVDAVGVGTFSVEANELERLRRAELVSLSGQRLTPTPILVLPFETANPVELRLHPGGEIELSFLGSCLRENDPPPCFPEPELVQEGDVAIFDVSFRNFAGEAESDFASNVESYLEKGDAQLIDQFLENTTSTRREELLSLAPEIPGRALARVLNILVYEKLVEHYEQHFSLLDKRVTLGLWSNHFADRSLSDYCFPDKQPDCQALDEHLRTFESNVLARLREQGHVIYLKTDVSLDEFGEPDALDRRRPHFSLFDGLFLELNPARQDGSALDHVAGYERAIASIAADIGPAMPVHLTPWAGPMVFYLEGQQCEAAICPSAFSDYYAFNERLLVAALQAFTQEQLAGFGIPLFEAMTFDLKDPTPLIQGLRTNRAAETLANNPLLNVYLTR